MTFYLTKIFQKGNETYETWMLYECADLDHVV